VKRAIATRTLAAAALAALPPAAAPAQDAILPLAIEDAVGALRLQSGAGEGAISPDGKLLAYAVCDPRRLRGDTTGMGAATPNSAFRSAGCELRIATLAGRTTHTIASERGGHWGPSWSPDGSRLAFYSDRDGVAGLWIWDRGSGRLRRAATEETRTLFTSDRPLWTPDGRRLVVKLLAEGVPREALSLLPRRQAPADTVAGSTLILYRSGPRAGNAEVPATTGAAPYEAFAVLDLERGRIRRLVPRTTARWARLSPDGRWLSWLAPVEDEEVGSYDLRLVELAGGRERTLAARVRQQSAQAVAWSPDGTHLAYISRPKPLAARTGTVVSSSMGPAAEGDADLYVVAVDSGEPRRLVGRREGGLSSLDYGPLWGPASDELVAAGGRRLWRASLASGTLAEVPTDLPVTEVVRSFDGRTYWSPDGGASAYVLTTDSATLTSGYAAVDLRTGAARELLRGRWSLGRLSAGPVVTPRGDAAVYVAESGERSEDLWLTESERGRPRRLTTLNPQLDRYAFGTARLIEYRSIDGGPLRGSLLLPVGYRAGTRYPLVVWVYASDQGSRHLHRFGLTGFPAYNMQMLATRGYAVLRPDIPVKVGTPMGDLLKAVSPAVDRVIELGIADPERLAVMGQSNGGYSTLALIVQTRRFKAAVMNAGFGDLIGLHGSMHSSTGAGRWHAWLERQGGAMGAAPWEAPLRYVENSPIFYLDRVETPLLLQAGGADAGVVQYSDQVFVELKRLGKDVTYLRYEGEGHVLAQYPNLADYWKRVVAFLDAKLKGASGEAAGAGRASQVDEVGADAYRALGFTPRGPSRERQVREDGSDAKRSPGSDGDGRRSSDDARVP
jgi:dipeptidyl aminopeptidase/acylaminoacyl peptidase